MIDLDLENLLAPLSVESSAELDLTNDAELPHARAGTSAAGKAGQQILQGDPRLSASAKDADYMGRRW